MELATSSTSLSCQVQGPRFLFHKKVRNLRCSCIASPDSWRCALLLQMTLDEVECLIMKVPEEGLLYISVDVLLFVRKKIAEPQGH